MKYRRLMYIDIPEPRRRYSAVFWEIILVQIIFDSIVMHFDHDSFIFYLIVSTMWLGTMTRPWTPNNTCWSSFSARVHLAKRSQCLGSDVFGVNQVCILLLLQGLTASQLRSCQVEKVYVWLGLKMGAQHQEFPWSHIFGLGVIGWEHGLGGLGS